MATGSQHLKILLEKIDRLSPERVAEIEDFVDFIQQRDQDQRLTRAAASASETTFQNVWDNTDDAAYDQL